MKKVLPVVILISMLLTLLSGCSASGNLKGGDNIDDLLMPPDAESPAEGGLPAQDADAPTFAENPFIATQEEAVSTFSADVDTASYTYFRKLVNSGYSLRGLMQEGTSFRTEEFLNYFKYQASAPQGGELFGVKAAIADCPWNPDTVLMTLTLQAEEAVPEGGNNLVFLIDVSGSMRSSDKLPLLKKAFSYLVAQLSAEDRVSIVTYSGKVEVVLSGCPGSQGEKIMEAINRLVVNGSTNGEAGLQEAYRVAAENRIEGGNNRIIMASDGDLNVGISDDEELKAFVEQKREEGTYLSVLGFGTGNYRDSKMETLADNGNGVYYYIDGESEAERIFGTELLSTLYTVANDVKLQITFDPACVASYRLIGYENRILDKEDFEDDTKDAGEVGAGHQVTVCYELTLTAKAAEADEWMKLAVRYKRPGESVSQLDEYAIGQGNVTTEPDEDFRFQSAVILTAMVLHNSQYLNDINLDNVLDMLSSLDLSSAPDRSEFRDLVRKLVTESESADL